MNRVFASTHCSGGALRSLGLGAAAVLGQCTQTGGYCQGYTQQGYFGWQLPTR